METRVAVMSIIVEDPNSVESRNTFLHKNGKDMIGRMGIPYHKESFDTAMSLGDSVWTYVCCGPSGHWLNRFLDTPVNHGRLLFWGCAKYGIEGYLHWGWNQFPGVPNPFEKTSCYNPTGIGTDYPCGDAFIVYPGTDGPWISLRFEA